MLLDAPRLVVIPIFLVGDTPRPKYHALLLPLAAPPWGGSQHNTTPQSSCPHGHWARSYMIGPPSLSQPLFSSSSSTFPLL